MRPLFTCQLQYNRPEKWFPNQLSFKPFTWSLFLPYCYAMKHQCLSFFFSILFLTDRINTFSVQQSDGGVEEMVWWDKCRLCLAPTYYCSGICTDTHFLYTSERLKAKGQLFCLVWQRFIQILDLSSFALNIVCHAWRSVLTAYISHICGVVGSF